MEEDKLRGLCINQGYVKENCKLPGQLIWVLINKGENPCIGCNLKEICNKS